MFSWRTVIGTSEIIGRLQGQGLFQPSAEEWSVGVCDAVSWGRGRWRGDAAAAGGGVGAGGRRRFWDVGVVTESRQHVGTAAITGWVAFAAIHAYLMGVQSHLGWDVSGQSSVEPRKNNYHLVSCWISKQSECGFETRFSSKLDELSLSGLLKYFNVRKANLDWRFEKKCGLCSPELSGMW